MKCIKCGAHVNAYETNCPYCGTALEKGIRWNIRHNSAKDNYDSALKAKTGIYMSAFNRIVSVVLKVELALTALIMVIVIIISSVKPLKTALNFKLHKNQINAHINQLYEDEKYAELYSYLQEYGLNYKEGYEIYTELSNKAYYYNWFVCERNDLVMSVETGTTRRIDIEILLDRIGDILYDVKEPVFEKNSAKINIWKQDVEDFCRYYLFMSEDDINLFKTQSYLKTADEERIIQDFAEKRGFRYVD